MFGVLRWMVFVATLALPLAMSRAAAADVPTQTRLQAILSEADSGSIAPLLDFARTQPPEVRHRVAIVVASLGHPAEAVALYPDDPATLSAVAEIRLASWSLGAHDAALAQRHAWRAFERAATPQDRLYALGVLVEAHRLDDSLDALSAKFALQPHPGEELRRIQLGLLREQKRFQEAIELLQREAARSHSPQGSKQLLSLYRQAGDDDSLLRAYRASIAAEPGCVACYAGLAEFFVLRDRRADARQLWSEFFARNRDVATVLAGAAAMAQMAFADLAIEGVEALLRNDASNTEALFFLADLHVSAGRTTESEQVLARLDRLLVPTAPARIGLAEMYARMNRPRQAIVILQGLQQAGALDVAGQIRLAQLHSVNGEPLPALEVWFSLWTHLDNPAQRSTVESGLIALATEQNRLAELSQRLRARVTAAASPSDRRDAASLLVKMQLRAADQRGALETIDTYLDGAQDSRQRVMALREKLAVYRFMNDRSGYEQIARQLMALDHDGRGDYLRGLILIRLQQPDEQRLPQLRGLLNELRRVEGGAAVNGEFEAGVLADAGATEAAIEAYRRAIARDPQRSDNYLLLAAALARHDRQDEAFTMLQDLARSARNDELFVAAIDGIINTAGGQNASRYPGVLQWAWVSVLERLIVKGEASYLYALLSDVSAERSNLGAGELQRQLDVMENSLAADSQRRVTVLRELLTLTAAGERTDGGAGASDPQRHLAYGRRLIALGEELPPDVYIDLGRAMLELSDPASAMNAFELAIETSFEQADMLRRSAALLAKAGHEELALAQYRRAAVRNSDDIEIAVRIALLLEQLGRYPEAHEGYANTLATLIVRQPARGAEAVTRDYRMHHDVLLQGLLRTWPQAPKAQQQTLQTLDDVFQRELQSSHDDAQPADSEALTRFNRLRLAAGLVRRVALAGERVDAADRMDAQLLQRFPADKELRAALVSERLDYGYARSAHSLLAGMGMENMAAPEMERAMAVLDGDSKRILALASSWADTGAYVKAASWAFGRLDAADARRFNEHLLQLLRKDSQLVEQLLRDQEGALAALLIRIESATQQHVVPEAELLRALLDSSPRLAAQTGLPSAVAPYIGLRLSPAELVEVLQRLAIQPAGRPGRLQTMTALYRELLRRPLDASIAARVAALMTEVIAAEPMLPDLAAPDVIVALLRFDMAPGNVPVAQRLARQWAAKIGSTHDYTEPLALLERGETAAAARNYLELLGKLQDQPPPPEELFAYQYVLGAMQSLFFVTHLAVTEAQLDAMQARQGLSFAVIAARGQLAEVLQRDSGAAWMATLRAAAQANPRDARFLLLLHQACQRAGRHREALEALSRLHALDPQESLYRGALFAELLRTGNFVAASALNAASGVDMRTDNFAADMTSRSNMMGALAMALPRPADAMQAVLASQGEGAEEMGAESAVRAPVSNDLFAAATVRIAAAAQQPDGDSELRNAIRTLWISTTLPREDGTNATAGTIPAPLHRPVEALRLDWLEQKRGDVMEATAAVDPALEQPTLPAVQTPKLYGELANRAFGTDEIEAVLRSLPQPVSNELAPLYGYLASAYVSRGVSVAKLHELASKLAAEGGNQNDLSLWLALMDAIQRVPDAAALSLMRQNSSQQQRRSEYQLLQLGRGFARAGAIDDAAAAYRRLIARSLYGDGDTFDGLMSASALVEEVCAHFAMTQRGDLLRSILRMVEPDDNAAASHKESYRAFALRVLPQSLPPAEALAHWRAVLDAAPAPASLEDQLKEAAFHARVGQPDRALSQMKSAMVQRVMPPASYDSLGSSSQSGSARYAAMLGGAALQSGLSLLFPGPDEQWPGASAWLEMASARLIEMSGDATLDADAVVRALALAASRLKQLGAAASAAAAFGRIEAILRVDGELRQETIAAIVQEVERSADPHLGALLAGQIEQGRTEAAALAEQVEKITQSGNSELALAAARKAAEYSHVEPLLDALIARSSGTADCAETDHWQTVRAAERAAREKLSGAEYP